jgi:hypothetical protein
MAAGKPERRLPSSRSPACPRSGRDAPAVDTERSFTTNVGASPDCTGRRWPCHASMGTLRRTATSLETSLHRWTAMHLDHGRERLYYPGIALGGTAGGDAERRRPWIAHQPPSSTSRRGRSARSSGRRTAGSSPPIARPRTDFGTETGTSLFRPAASHPTFRSFLPEPNSQDGARQMSLSDRLDPPVGGRDVFREGGEGESQACVAVGSRSGGSETRLNEAGVAFPTESRDRRQAFGAKPFSEVCSFGWNLFPR